MTKPGKRVEAGRYYGQRPDGRLEDVAPAPPDVVICRRVADFPGGQAPVGAAVQGCTQCQAPIAFNPARHYAAPLVCMQCAQIQPDPFPTQES